ncbi:MAG TPA: hypothetical protein VK694_00220 [Verrucomicrobiae bacterium]|nr:hypothetical protein [Verrucomicrobiae bacterium]
MARLVGEEDDPGVQRQAVQDAFQSLAQAEFTPDWRHVIGVVVGRIIRPHRVRGVISALRDAAAPFESTLPTESAVFTRDKIHKGPAGLSIWLSTKTVSAVGIATAPEGRLEPPETVSTEHEAKEAAEEAPCHAEMRLTDILPWADVSVDPRLTQLEPDHLRLLQLPGEIRGLLTEKVAAEELGVEMHVARAFLGKLVLLGLVEEEKRRAYSIYRLRSQPLPDEPEV